MIRETICWHTRKATERRYVPGSRTLESVDNYRLNDKRRCATFVGLSSVDRENRNDECHKVLLIRVNVVQVV